MNDYRDRQYPRVRVAATVDVSSDALLLYNHIENISLGGLCISLPAVLDVGTVVDLVINFSSIGDEIQVEGVVVWCSDDPEIVAGVKFINLEGEAREKIRNYLYRRMGKG